MHRGRNTNAGETTVAIDELRFRNLGKIMVLRGDPENRNGFRATLRKTPGKFDGRQRFVDCVKWSGKESCLLSGNHGDAIRFV